jgi:hypothetical protein
MNIKDVKNWVITQATADDMEVIKRAMATRKELLVDEIAEGDSIRLSGLSPKYLNGLTGKFHERGNGRGKSRGSVVLDEASTKVLRVKGRNRFFIPPDNKEYTLGGLPMTCIAKVG